MALTLSEQLQDGATHVFILIHLAALATPFIYGVSWRDVALVFVTYNLRMFGEQLKSEAARPNSSVRRFF